MVEWHGGACHGGGETAIREAAVFYFVWGVLYIMGDTPLRSVIPQRSLIMIYWASFKAYYGLISDNEK